MQFTGRSLFIAVIVGLGIWPAAAQIPAPPMVLKNLTLIDGTGKVQEHVSIEIRGGRIWEIGPDLEPKRGEKVIDESGTFAIPGLVDTRVQLAVSPANHMFRSEVGAEQRLAWLHTMLRLGVTSTRLIQGDLREQSSFQRFRNEDLLNSPALFLSGPTFTAPNGTPTEQYGGLGSAMRQRELLEIATPDDARDKARAFAHSGGNVFEIVYSSGPDAASAPRLNDDAFAIVVKEAHGHDLRAFCWVGHNAEALKAIATGCDVLEGASEEVLSDEVLKQMADKQIPYLPALVSQGYLLNHLLAPDALKEYRADPVVAANLSKVMQDSLDSKGGQLASLRKLKDVPLGATPEEMQRAILRPESAKPQQDATDKHDKPTIGDTFAEQEKRAFENVTRAKAAGVKIIVGTGAGGPLNFAGLSTHLEMKLLVDNGFSNLEALQAATRNAAVALGKQEEIGTLEKGKKADLVILESNPLVDIRNAEKIKTVVRNGWVVQPSEMDVY